jgi:heat shock protein 5
MNLFKKTMKPVKQVLRDANVKKEAISEVVLVSHGSNEPSGKGINPDEGDHAAVQDGILAGV